MTGVWRSLPTPQLSLAPHMAGGHPSTTWHTKAKNNEVRNIIATESFRMSWDRTQTRSIFSVADIFPRFQKRKIWVNRLKKSQRQVVGHAVWGSVFVQLLCSSHGPVLKWTKIPLAARGSCTLIAFKTVEICSFAPVIFIRFETVMRASLDS